MYAYCNNNPVNLWDPTGCAALGGLGTAMGVAVLVGAYFTIMTEYVGSSVTNVVASLEVLGRLPLNGFASALTRTILGLEKNNFAPPSAKKDYSPALLLGGGLAMLDTPAPGPADLLGAVVMVAGIIYIASKANPNDLKKGMSQFQKGKFTDEIHWDG